MKALSAVLAFSVALFCRAGQMEPLNVAATGYPPGIEASPVGHELLAKSMQRETSILLRSGIFDPCITGAGEEASSLFSKRPPLPIDAWIVQFDRALDAGDISLIVGLGFTFSDCIPHHTYIIRGSAARFSEIRRLPAFRWSELFAGACKVEPRLLCADWRQPVLVDVTLFSKEDQLTFIARIEDKTSRADLVAKLGGSAGLTLRFLVQPEYIHEFCIAVADEPSVWKVDPWFLPHPTNDHSVWVIQSYDTVDKTSYDLSATMWSHGLTGTGQTPAVCDTGCDSDMCFFRLSAEPSAVTDAQYPPLPETGAIDLSKKVPAYYVLPGATPYDGSYTCSGGMLHGTHTCGSLLGDNYATPSTPSSGGHDTGDGMAPNSRLIFQDAGKETTGCLDGLANDYSLIFEQAYEAGARIHSNSWGNDTYGAYTNDCQVVDRFTYLHEDMLFFFSAGNAGSAAGSIGSPAGAKNCVAVGATLHGSSGANALASFSSRGPTSDGRLKPDMCAPGSGILSAMGDTSHTDGNCGTWTKSGTSMAAPTAAGGATLMRQYFVDGFYPGGSRDPNNRMLPSAALVKAALANGAVDVQIASGGSVLNSLTPDNSQGFGRILLDTVCYFRGDNRKLRIWDKWNEAGLSTGEAEEFHMQVAPGQPLKVTLAWSDPEASGLSAIILVNDLDLEVVDPSGVIYTGNSFAGGQSFPGGNPDRLNNLEEVFIREPAHGIWTLRARASSVPGNFLEPYSKRQGYALVATFASCSSALAKPPAAIAASDAGSGGIAVSWSAVEEASSYQIYRAEGACPENGGAFHYLATISTTVFNDRGVQGGFEYSYAVRAVDACSEGHLSPCATATFTGKCTMYPEFSGLKTVSDDPSTPECDLLLRWDPGIPICPDAQSLSYNVYRGSTPYLSPGPDNLLATGISGTSYRDAAVPSLVTQYYVVRAEDSSSDGTGPANSGNEESNLLWRQAIPTGGGTAPGTWSDDGGDTLAWLDLQRPWIISSQENHTPSGTLAYHCAPDGLTYPSNTCASAATPAIRLQAGSPTLSYWARYNLESGWDGVVLEASSDGGKTWGAIAPAGGYPGSFAQTGNPPINACLYSASQACFNGPPGNAALTQWTRYSHDLSALAGGQVSLRWRLSSDAGAEYQGFYLDDIEIAAAEVAMPCASCQVDCSASASAVGGVVPLTVSFKSGASTISCSQPANVRWDFGDGTTSDELGPDHTYQSPATYTWTMTAQSGGVMCVKSGTVEAAQFDLTYKDDLGRSELKISSKSGQWQWDVLEGQGSGAYSGFGILVSGGSGISLSSLEQDQWQLHFTRDEAGRIAYGSFVYRAERVRSELLDLNLQRRSDQ